MNCKKCGSSLEPNAKFCINCGEKVEELNSQAGTAQVQQPILPDAPEAPLPGTANKVVDAPQAPVAPAQPEVQPVAPAAPVAPQAPVAPTTPVAPQAPVAPQTSVAPQTPAPATQPTSNKNSNMFVIIIIAVLAICAGVLLFVLLYGTKGLENKGKTTTTTTESTTTKTTKKITTTKKVNEQVVNGVSFEVPDGWTYSKTTSSGKITNASGGTSICIYPFPNAIYSQYRQNPNVIEQSIIQNGLEIVDRATQQVGNQEYIMFNTKYNNITTVLMFTSIPSGEIIRFQVTAADMEFEELARYTNSIAASAKVVGNVQGFSGELTNNME